MRVRACLEDESEQDTKALFAITVYMAFDAREIGYPACFWGKARILPAAPKLRSRVRIPANELSCPTIEPAG